MRTRTSYLALIGLALAACAQTPEQALRAPLTVPTDPYATPAAALESPLIDALPKVLARTSAPEGATLLAFYRGRGFAPVWHDGGPYAEARPRVVVTLVERGLVPPAPADGAAVDAVVLHEVALSAAALDLTVETTAGMDPGTLAMLDGLARAIRSAAPAEPVLPFAGQALGIERYGVIAAAGGWPSVPSGPNLEPGAIDDRVPVLRERLIASGDLADDGASGTLYDATLVAAVERFQARHGLRVDGEVGPATLGALNVPAKGRLAQLQQAATRYDAIARGLGQRFVMVNVPAFELQYVRGGDVRHRVDVIVGSRANPTVEFSDTIDHLVFNPFWHVPASIAREELIHDFREDAAGMVARGFQVVDASGTSVPATAVDWNEVPASRIPYRFRQGPGAANALGQVKFMFPNAHAIYLHDTPSKRLFDRPMRALSHGCIRVRDPLVLAERLLEVDGVDRDTIENWVGDGRNRRVGLANPVPVHLVYVTAWVEPDGTVHFRHDIYGRDGHS